MTAVLEQDEVAVTIALPKGMRISPEALDLMVDKMEHQAARFISDIQNESSTDEIILKKHVERVIAEASKRRSAADWVKRFVPSVLVFTLSQTAAILVPSGLWWVPSILGAATTLVLIVLAIGLGPMASRRR